MTIRRPMIPLDVALAQVAARRSRPRLTLRSFRRRVWAEASTLIPFPRARR